MKPNAVLLVAFVVPLLVAARDPRGDVAPCGAGIVPSVAPDLVAVDGYADELGSAAVWRLRFAQPIQLGTGVRIDVVVRDPLLPAMTIGNERGGNRIVRWDAGSAATPVEIIWGPEHSHTTFNPPVIHGDTIEIRIPGRLLLGESPNGTEDVSRARWGVAVAAPGGCDRLGSGVPTYRFAAVSPPSTSSVAPGPAATVSRPTPARGWWIAAVALGAVVVALLATWIPRVRSRS